MKSIIHLTFLILLLFFSACRKSKPVLFSGQLLLTKTHPTALANRKIQIYQAGSPSAILFSASSSTAVSKTDANGYFNLSFTAGSTTFLIFSGTNTGSLFFSSDDTSFPQFHRKNLLDSNYNSTKPTFIGKSIDTAIIKVDLLSNLEATDTIGVDGYTLNGSFDKEYTGLKGTAGSVLILDTITNMLFTDFDCSTQTFTNNLYAGRKWTTIYGYVTITSEGFPSPYQLSTDDETKKELMFYFKK
jgi:hypothetical protein